MREQSGKIRCPNCPTCSGMMLPFRILPELGERPRLEIFECRCCHEFETQAPELKSAQRAG